MNRIIFYIFSVVYIRKNYKLWIWEWKTFEGNNAFDLNFSTEIFLYEMKYGLLIQPAYNAGISEKLLISPSREPENYRISSFWNFRKQ